MALISHTVSRDGYQRKKVSGKKYTNARYTRTEREMYDLLREELPKVAAKQQLALVGQPEYVQNGDGSITATCQCR
jgi:hypothetical protein